MSRAVDLSWELVTGEGVVRVCADEAEGAHWGLGQFANDWPPHEDLREEDLMNADLF